MTAESANVGHKVSETDPIGEMYEEKGAIGDDDGAVELGGAVPH